MLHPCARCCRVRPVKLVLELFTFRHVHMLVDVQCVHCLFIGRCMCTLRKNTYIFKWHIPKISKSRLSHYGVISPQGTMERGSGISKIFRVVSPPPTKMLFGGCEKALWGHRHLTQDLQALENHLREFALCSSRHPGPRRVWKGGSDLPGMRSVPADLADRRNEFRLTFPCEILCAGAVVESPCSQKSRAHRSN